MYQVTSTQAAQVSDSLHVVLDLATLFRHCELEIPVDIELWLLNNEVFAYEGLQQYDEADSLVTRFFDTYFDKEETSDFYRAKFYMWRLHLSALFGNGIGIIIDYLEAQRYASALDQTHQAKLLLDGSQAYMSIRDYEEARKLAEEAKSLLSPSPSFKDSLALARAMHTGAEAQLHLRARLGQVKEDLRAAATLYGVLGDTSKVAAITTLLGETHAADGDTSLALSEMATGVALAKKAGNARSEVYALFRQGQLRRKVGDWEGAEQSLLHSLNVSESLHEYDLRIRYELARLYEEKRDYDRAASYYEAVIDAPHPNDTAEELDAVRRARDGRIRILLIEQERSETVFWLAVAGMLVLLGLVGAGFFRYIRRRAALYDKIRESVVLPEDLRTGLSLDALERRFQEIANSKLLGKRLAYVYAVLFDPALVLDYIDDAYLKPQVEAHSLENNTALFECAAAVEEAVDEHRTFRGSAANTMRSYLLSEFRKRDWAWPKSPLAWKRHFLKYHVKRLV